MKKKLPIGLLRMAVIAGACTTACAYANTRIAAADLADLDLEQLTKINVMSASRRLEPLLDAAASIYVITQEDIRRSGATSIPEALRLAPNLNVARADANQYAISARGFNNVLANKMLVLIDGRTVYTPLFSGVFWEAQDILLADVERIEVISGPGATLWGENAVNGVINIITFSSAATQGSYGYASGGNLERGAALRHGGALGDDGHWRVYAKYFERDSRRTDAGVDVGDNSKMLTGGARADWGTDRSGFTLQGDAYSGEVDGSPERKFTGQNVVGRWARTNDDGSALKVQGYYDRTTRRHERTFDEDLSTFDLELQHAWKPVAGHELVWGGGYRYSRDHVENSPTQAFIPPNRDLSWTNLFAQDEISLTPMFSVTLGAKAEHNPYTGTEWLPSARFSWHPQPDRLVWGALSRAVRAPSRLESDLFIPGAPPYVLTGNSAFEGEVAKVAELGYRAQMGASVSFSATLFRQEYPNLRSVGIVNGAVAFRNDIEGRVQGVETWGTWRVTPAWKLTGGFVVQDVERHVKAGALDLGGLQSLGNDAERWGSIRSYWNPMDDVDVDIGVRHVGALEFTVPAYTVVDMRVAWRPTRSIELSVTAQNAADRDYFEWNNRVINERSVFAKVTWRH
jgi:iron complex outermembrane recepter protein